MPAGLLDRVTADMEQRYGIDIAINFTPGPPSSVMSGRLVEETAAGETPSTDIFLATSGSLKAAIDGNAIEEVDWMALSEAVTEEMARSGGGYGLPVFVRYQPTVVFNTNLVPPDQAPRTYEDVLDEKFRNAVATTPYFASWDASAFFLGEERILDFAEKFGETQLAGFMGCGESERIATGEFTLLFVGCGHNWYLQGEAEGAPVAIRTMTGEDKVWAGSEYYAVPVKSPNPNMAKLFAIYMATTPEAQTIMWEEWYQDSMFIEGTRSWIELQGITARGQEVIEVDVQFQRDNQDALRQLNGRIRAILGR